MDDNTNSRKYWKRVPKPLRLSILAVCVLFMFLTGYSMTSSVMIARQCQAQIPGFGGDDPLLIDDLSFFQPSGPATENVVLEFYCNCTPPATYPNPCTPISVTERWLDRANAQFEDDLIDAARALEAYIADWLVDSMVTVVLVSVNHAERNLIDWWDTFWFYNFYPAAQDMTEQMGVSMSEQVRQMQVAADAQIANDANRIRTNAQIDAGGAIPAENTAVVATLVGGHQRQAVLSKRMRVMMEDADTARRTSRRGSGALSANAKKIVRYRGYEERYCDPAANGGANLCPGGGAPVNYRNADTQVTRRLFDDLTIEVDDGLETGANGVSP